MLSKVLNSSTGAPCAAAHIVNSWGLQVLPPPPPGKRSKYQVVQRKQQYKRFQLIQFEKPKYGMCTYYPFLLPHNGDQDVNDLT